MCCVLSSSVSLLSCNICVDDDSAGDDGEHYSHASGIGDGLSVGVGHEADIGDGGTREQGEPTQRVVSVGAIVQRGAVRGRERAIRLHRNTPTAERQREFVSYQH